MAASCSFSSFDLFQSTDEFRYTN